MTLSEVLYLFFKTFRPQTQDGGEEFVPSPLQREKDRACPELDSGMRVK